MIREKIESNTERERIKTENADDVDTMQGDDNDVGDSMPEINELL